MTRDIGTMAQARLVDWAAQVLITANPATIDREAWDYFLQFPPTEPAKPTPLDLRPARIECLVQVKGIGTPQKRKRIKLSNWERLAKSPLPAFFLVIDFEQGNDPQQAYLIHVGDKWITKVLKRLREIEPTQAAALNKRYLYLTWSEEDRLATLDGQGLKRAIEAHIGDNMESYLRNKAKILEESGDPTPALLRFSAVFQDAREMWTELVDLAIGARDEISTSSMIVEEDVRFGIPLKRTQHGEGTLAITRRPAADSELLFRNNDNTQRSVFPAKVYLPHYFFPGEPPPKEYWKARIRFEIGEMTIYPGTREPTITFNFKQTQEPRPLRAHANLWRVATILRDAKTDGCVLEMKGMDGVFTFDLQDPQLRAELLDIARAVDNAWFLARQFDIPPQTELMLGQIIQQQRLLENLRAICDVNHPFSGIRAEITGGTLDPEQEVAVTFLQAIVFGAIPVAVGLGIAGMPLIEGQTLRIERSRLVLLEHFPNWPLQRALDEQLLEHISQKLESQGYQVVTLVDFRPT